MFGNKKKPPVSNAAEVTKTASVPASPLSESPTSRLVRRLLDFVAHLTSSCHQIVAVDPHAVGAPELGQFE